MLERTNLVGTPGEIRERLAAYREAGVSHLSITPVGDDPVRVVERLRGLLD